LYLLRLHIYELRCVCRLINYNLVDTDLQQVTLKLLPLQELLGGGAHDFAASRVMQLQQKTKQAVWVCQRTDSMDSTSGEVRLEYLVPPHHKDAVIAEHGLAELLDFQVGILICSCSHW
jgi:hypothetical protein